ncbi:hypothetical protein GJ496_004787 [Pomphorhynchus laevis]|nr:hypothetical protein GJ496_004787 [Pomphorhynchus laevis]
MCSAIGGSKKVNSSSKMNEKTSDFGKKDDISKIGGVSSNNETAKKSTIKAFRCVPHHNTKDVMDVSQQLLKNIKEQAGSYGDMLSDDICTKINVLLRAAKENPANYSTIENLLYYERCQANKQDRVISASYLWLHRYNKLGVRITHKILLKYCLNNESISICKDIISSFSEVTRNDTNTISSGDMYYNEYETILGVHHYYSLKLVYMFIFKHAAYDYKDMILLMSNYDSANIENTIEMLYYIIKVFESSDINKIVDTEPDMVNCKVLDQLINKNISVM